MSHSNVEVAKELCAEGDPGQKELAIADTLIRVRENLCQDESINGAERNAAPLYIGAISAKLISCDA